MTASPWEHAPWFIGGGVNHDESIARLVSYAAFGGNEGIIGAGDLKVSPTSPGSGAVAIAPGACAIRNQAAGSLYEAYAARLPVADQVAIAAQPAGSTRYDLVVARIEDPFEEVGRWPVPAASALQTSQYVRTVVIPNVASTVRSLADVTPRYTGIPLALITMNPSQTVVNDNSILDLRNVYLPQTEKGLNKIVAPTQEHRVNSSGFNEWIPEANTDVNIPTWATHFTCRVIIGTAQFGQPKTGSGENANPGGGQANGQVRMKLGAINGDTTTYAVDSDAGVDSTTIMFGAAKTAIPAGARGTTVQFQIQALYTNGSTKLFVNGKSMVSIELDWIKAAS